MLPKCVIEKFWKKVDKKGDDECWIWKCKPGYSYPMLSLTGSEVDECHEAGYPFSNYILGHRLSLMIKLGRYISTEEHALHKCPGGGCHLCVNPNHLYLGGHKDNGSDRVLEKKIRRAIELRDEGYSLIDIAEEIDLDIGSVFKHLSVNSI